MQGTELTSASQPVYDPPAYTVNEFCSAHNITRGYLYRLWREGAGPRKIKIGRKTLIAGEDAASWRRSLVVNPDTAEGRGAQEQQCPADG